MSAILTQNSQLEDASPRFWKRQLDKMADAYANEPDPARKQILKDSYREITGEEIEARLRSLD